MKLGRRNFITTGVAAVVVPGVFAEDSSKGTPPGAPKPAPVERKRPPPQELAEVLRFVQAGHGDLMKVKEMLAHDPRFAIATWDRGQGDGEAGAKSTLTILPGAGHEDPAYMATQMVPTVAFLDQIFGR